MFYKFIYICIIFENKELTLGNDNFAERILLTMIILILENRLIDKEALQTILKKILIL